MEFHEGIKIVDISDYCPNIMVIVNDDSGKPVKARARDLLPFTWQPVV